MHTYYKFKRLSGSKCISFFVNLILKINVKSLQQIYICCRDFTIFVLLGANIIICYLELGRTLLEINSCLNVKCIKYLYSKNLQCLAQTLSYSNSQFKIQAQNYILHQKIIRVGVSKNKPSSII